MKKKTKRLKLPWNKLLVHNMNRKRHFGPFLVRQDVLFEYGTIPLNIQGMEDHLFLTELLRAIKIVLIVERMTL